MPNPIVRHQMPMVTYRTQYAQQHAPSRQENHGHFGFVHIHRPFEDCFRKSITIPHVNPLLGGGGGDQPETFNRSSLIKYLNAEIAHFNEHPVHGQQPLPPRLHIGWFGGRIGGSSDARIRTAYQRVFECYQPFYQSLQTPRSLSKDILIRSPVVEETPEMGIQGRPHACSKEYLNGAAQVSLFRSDPLQAQLPSLDSFPSCDLRIYIRDPNVDISALMEAITTDGTFFGSHGEDSPVSASILVRQIYVDSLLGEAAGTVEAIIDWQRTQQYSRTKRLNTEVIERARVERDEALAGCDSLGAWCPCRGSWLLRRSEDGSSWLPLSAPREGAFVRVDLHEVTDDTEEVVMLPHQKGNFYMRIRILNSQFLTQCLESHENLLLNLIRGIDFTEVTCAHSIDVDLITISIDETILLDLVQREAQERQLQEDLKGLLEWKSQARGRLVCRIHGVPVR